MILDGKSKIGNAKVYATQKEMDQEKEIERLKEELKGYVEFTEEVTDRIDPKDENLARFYYGGKTLLRGSKK